MVCVSIHSWRLAIEYCRVFRGEIRKEYALDQFLGVHASNRCLVSYSRLLDSYYSGSHSVHRRCDQKISADHRGRIWALAGIALVCLGSEIRVWLPCQCTNRKPSI